MNMIDIHTEATNAAKRAVGEFLDKWEKDTGGNKYGEPMCCGFAWVDVEVTRSNSKEAKLLKTVGFEPSWRPKRMQLWDPAQHHGQSVDCKEVGARAYAEVLQRHGFKAYAGSRLD